MKKIALKHSVSVHVFYKTVRTAKTRISEKTATSEAQYSAIIVNGFCLSFSTFYSLRNNTACIRWFFNWQSFC